MLPPLLLALSLASATVPIVREQQGTGVTFPSVRNFLGRMSPFTVQKSGGTVYVRTSWSETEDLVQRVYITQGVANINDVVNWQGARTIPIATAAASTETAFNDSTAILAAQGDDPGPPLYNGQRAGGNHGPLAVLSITATGHGKTAEDVGSIWADGGAKAWTIVKRVDANTLWIMPENTGTATVWSFPTAITGTTLTHTSGATHTTDINFGSPTATQTRPVQHSHSKVLAFDGVTISDDGVYTGRTFDIIEQYDIPNMATALAFVQAGVGSATAPTLNDSSIATQVRLSHTYRWTPDGSCVVYQTFTAVQDISLANGYAGPTQGGVLTFTGKTLSQYVPKVEPITGTLRTWDFDAVENISTQAETLYFTAATWTNAANPPDRWAQIVSDAGTKEYGFVLGYGRLTGVGMQGARPGLVGSPYGAGYFHSTRKQYLASFGGGGAAFSGDVMPAGTSFYATAYRAFFRSPALPEATVFAIYFDRGSPIVVLDFHETVSALAVPLPAAFAGARVEVLESSGLTVDAYTVSSTGTFPVTVAGAYGYAVLRLK